VVGLMKLLVITYELAFSNKGGIEEWLQHWSMWPNKYEKKINYSWNGCLPPSSKTLSSVVQLPS
jgi:hypothetical protein